jgi:signal transduction histidine kinase
MKTIVCLLFFIFILITKCFPQDSAIDILHINNVPPQGIVLDKGWKFISGDNPAYARPDYDDSQWKPIDPKKDIFDLPVFHEGIVWLRLKLDIHDRVRQQPLSWSIDQRGASEIYINGRLAYKFGVVSTDPKKIIAYIPGIFSKPFFFPSTKDSIYIIAIRYALQPGIFYTTNTHMTNPAFRSELNYLDHSVNLYREGNTHWTATVSFRIGAFFILFILHLAFFLYFPSLKANLYFSLFALFVILTDIFQVSLPAIHSVQFYFYHRTLALNFLLLSTFFLLTAIYSLSKQRRGWIFWGLLALLVLGILLNVFTYRLGDNVSIFIITILFNLEITRIAFLAVKQKQKGAIIIATGSIGFLVFWSIFLLDLLLHFGKYFIAPFTYGDVLSNLAFLSIPIATSIYLGLEFAFTSTSLKQKLAEVEILSTEKQQILADQNAMLEQQVGERTAELKQSLEELKSTQAQLIQSEKMASLGELTAGIAHEIQNPLNFVNNFSEVNKELIEELEQEADNRNIVEVKTIAKDIKENEEKILHHGKRADAIVKGMLQHSRASTGKKEPTDISALADEYLRLSYHGMRAKDKTFNATLQTNFDTSIGKINVVPQDMGRVLLNLFNNAFYATMQKKKELDADYEPTVSVFTKKVDGKIEVHVKDNGNGIPQKIVDKIFQPFFTTKPTGQGTGLGLSLSYDIIKAHGGEIKVDTKEGEGAHFIIELPST